MKEIMQFIWKVRVRLKKVLTPGHHPAKVHEVSIFLLQLDLEISLFLHLTFSCLEYFAFKSSIIQTV